MSTVGNSTFLVVLRRRLRAVSDGQTVLLMNAAFCDLGISITGYPYATISAFYGDWLFGDVICQLYGFLCFTLNEVQMNTLVVIAVFRYVSVCRPQFSLVVFCFLLQLVILIVSYYKILNKSRHLQLGWPDTDPRLFHVGEDDVNSSEGIKCCKYYVCLCESNFKNGVEKHVLWVNMMMVLSFIIFWTPYTVVSIISVFHTDLDTFWYVFPTVFAKTSCMMNPIIYGLSHKLLRRELLAFLKTCCCCYRDENAIKELADLRRRMAEGTYDKEGIYVGKVRVGLCACNGCVVGRRETLHAQMTVLARLQKNVSEHPEDDANPDRSGNTCAITLTDENSSGNSRSNISICIQGKQQEVINGNGNGGAIVDPKGWNCYTGDHQQELSSDSQPSPKIKPSCFQRLTSSSRRKKSSSQDDAETEETLQISVTTLNTKNITMMNEPEFPDEAAKGEREEMIIHTTSTSTVTPIDTITNTQSSI
ncbi:rhodopsin, GQ-coupled-like [Homarus americanus]|uniref:rhodopsin, GQ-coupled-like n=1 Tax=Homarus americanus TaxID=6706 RepID=UPI001C487708|nr:rhodopsin, GQ-coupled-like [Homarus americanus]